MYFPTSSALIEFLSGHSRNKGIPLSVGEISQTIKPHRQNQGILLTPSLKNWDHPLLRLHTLANTVGVLPDRKLERATICPTIASGHLYTDTINGIIEGSIRHDKNWWISWSPSSIWSLKLIARGHGLPKNSLMMLVLKAQVPNSCSLSPKEAPMMSWLHSW